MKLAANWGSSYNVSSASATSPATPERDIISRDTSGAVWRNTGNDKGSFGARTKIATGWQGCKGVF